MAQCHMDFKSLRQDLRIVALLKSPSISPVIGIVKNLFEVRVSSWCCAAGSVVGQGIADHPDVRKLGFTGSTEIGKTIMER